MKRIAPGVALGARRALAFALALVLAGCGSTTSPAPGSPMAPSPSTSTLPARTPTAPPSPSPSPTPVPVSAVVPVRGGKVAVPNGPSLTIPKGALKAPATATISTVPGPGGPSIAWPADLVGLAWSVDLGGAKLAKPATLELPFNPSALPAGTDPLTLLLAYRDDATGTWIPVPATVNAVAGAVTATVTHLSTWGLFSINWDYWLAFLKVAASSQITDLLQGLTTLTTHCVAKAKGFSVDNSNANKMFQACLSGATSTKTTVLVTNLRAFALEMSDPTGYLKPVLLGPGDSAKFAVKVTDPPPVTVSADMSSRGLRNSVIDILLRLTPRHELLTSSKNYELAVGVIATGVNAVWENLEISDDLDAGKYASAAEKAATLITDTDFVTAFVAGAKAAGVKYGFPILASISLNTLREILKVVNLGDLIVTTWSFFGDYFFNAHTEAKVSWTRLVPPAAPTETWMSYVNSEDALIRLTWRPRPGPLSGYYLYGHGGVGWPALPKQPTCDGPQIAQLPASTTSFETGGDDTVVIWICAFNAAGKSPAVWFHWR